MERRDIYKPIVFVLGAGASKPYGFPLGCELNNSMKAHFDVNAIREIKQVGHENIIPLFQKALAGHKYNTIDEFLENKTTFRNIGACLIAITFLTLEKSSVNINTVGPKLFPQSSLYESFFKLLGFDNKNPIDTNDISFVTINYERSLQHFFTENIEFNYHDKYIEEAREKLRKIDFVYAHGNIGDLSKIPYGYGQEAINQSVLRKATDKIMIVADTVEDTPEFQKAQKLIGDARTLIFLGFGYDQTTVKRFMKHVVFSNCSNIIGTAYNIPDDKERERIRNLFGDRIELHNKDVKAEDLVNKLNI